MGMGRLCAHVGDVAPEPLNKSSFDGTQRVAKTIVRGDHDYRPGTLMRRAIHESTPRFRHANASER